MRSSRCPFGRLLGRNWFRCYRISWTDILAWQREATLSGFIWAVLKVAARCSTAVGRCLGVSGGSATRPRKRLRCVLGMLSSLGRIMEEVCEPANLKEALRQVRSNKGTAGVDRMTVDQLDDYLKQHWPAIRDQLLNGTYESKPVRRVEIPKPDGGGWGTSSPSRPGTQPVSLNISLASFRRAIHFLGIALLMVRRSRQLRSQVRGLVLGAHREPPG
jgi:hypothetical protein